MPATSYWQTLKQIRTCPAESWPDAFPIGNGRLGAKVFGAVPSERLALNEDTLWSGGPAGTGVPELPALLPEIRAAVLSGHHARAEELTRRIKGPATTASYEPLADLYLDFMPTGKGEDYTRELDLDRAIAVVRYRVGEVRYTREAFVSYPDQVIVVRLTADRPGALSFDVRLESQLWHKVFARNNDTQVLVGKAPVIVDRKATDAAPVVYDRDWNGAGMKFECRLRLYREGGEDAVVARGRGNDPTDGRRLLVRNADRVVLLVSAVTGFRGADAEPLQDDDALAARNAAILDAAQAKLDAGRLLADHVADHRRLFRRVRIEIDPEPSDDERSKAGATHRSVRMLQSHRYRLIAASRPGSQPLNLQHLWNEDLIPAWNANYTLNENTQKHYFSVESANLAECHEPLLRMIEELAVRGGVTARALYNCRGWVVHHNTDLWRETRPVGRHPKWFMWPFGGVWLTLHLWDHYAFGGDIAFLRDKAYPLMKGAAEFVLDWLVEDADGRLVTAPSTSPENLFYDMEGNERPVCKASTADMVLTRELFHNVLEGAAVLGVDDDFTAEVRTAMDRLYPLQIGSRGQLLEWPGEFEDVDPHHRHASHLLGIWPGRTITRRGTPDLFAAVRRSLELRAEGATLPDKAGMWARLGDAEQALKHLPGPSAAALVEMLVQSHAGEIELLPALPVEWPAGRVSGLRARGGFEVDMEWTGGTLRCASLRHATGGTCRLRYGDAVCDVCVRAGEVAEVAFA